MTTARQPLPEPRPAGPAERPGTPDMLERYRDGEVDAFRELVTEYQDRLVNFFYRLCFDRDRAEDLAQELFLKLLRGAARYVPQGRLGTFVFRVATNLWIDHYRARKPQPRLYSLDAAVHEGEATLGSLHEAHGEAPVDDAIAIEERERLRAGIESLTEPHRLVFELAVYQQLPYAEIGAILDIPVGTVKSRMHNSVAALKNLLGGGDAGRGGAPDGAGDARRGG